MKKLILLGLLLLFIGCPSAPKNAALIYISQGEYTKAKQQILVGLKETPDDFELYCVLAKAEIGLANWVAATKAFESAFGIDSAKTINWMLKDKDNVSVYWQTFYNSAYALSSERKYTEALNSLRFSKMINPNDVNQYILEGAAYGELGNNEMANKSYIKALSIDPQNPEAYFRIGKALFEIKQYDSSIVYFNDAIKHFEYRYTKVEKVLFQNLPSHDNALHNEIIKLWSEKKETDLDQLIKVKLGFDGGLEAQKRNIENYFKTTDGLARSYYYLGMTYFNLKKNDLALNNLKKSLDLMPDDVDALYFIGLIQISMEKYQEAISYFEKLTQIKIDDFDAWYYMGACYYLLKNYKKAIEVLEENALRLNPESVEALKYLAQAYVIIGNEKKGREYQNKADLLEKEPR